MCPELPELSEYQLDCLQRFVRFELPIETLRKVLAPLVTFTLDGPATLQTVKYFGWHSEEPRQGEARRHRCRYRTGKN